MVSQPSSSASSFVHFVMDSSASFLHSSNSQSTSDDSLESSSSSFSVPSSPATTTASDASTSNLSIYFKIFIGLFLVLVILISILGNLLVCVAVSSDRRLRKLGNLFIVSLAIADLCVGALVMTFALANDLLDYWPFGPQLCEIWIAFDISCSTCSIINLCAIALDRFVHIKDPMRYNRWMTKKIVIGAVSLIWLVSCGISFGPISLGWHKPDHSADAASINHTEMLENTVQSPIVNITLPVHSSSTHRALHHLFRRHRNSRSTPFEFKSRKAQNNFFDTSQRYDTFNHISRSSSEAYLLNARSLSAQFSSSSNTLGYTENESMSPQCTLDLTPTYAVVSSIISFYLPCIVMLYLYAKLYSICKEHVKCIKSMTKFQPAPLPPIPQPLLSYNQPNLASTPLTATPTKTHPDAIPSTRISVSSNIGSTGGSHGATSQSHVTEHKAAITLGIIMGTFLVMWMPFFCINIVAAFCKTCIPGLVFKILTWLGYFNSCLNPAIYSIFNTEFRDAFRRILIRYLFNGDATAACSRLVPCKTPRSSTATVTGSLANSHIHLTQNNNMYSTKNHFNVMTNALATTTKNAGNFPRASMDNGSLDSGILNASPQDHDNQANEDVEVELIFKQKSHEPTLNSPNNIRFCSKILCDSTQTIHDNNLTVVDKPKETFFSSPENTSSDGHSLNQQFDNPKAASLHSKRKGSHPLIPKILKIKPRFSQFSQHQSLDYENNSLNSQQVSHKLHKQRNGSSSSLSNGTHSELEENNNTTNPQNAKLCTSKNQHNTSQITQL